MARQRTTKTPAKRRTKASTNGHGYSMNEGHKEALALGRQQGRIVKSYLEALESHSPKRGRPRNPESIQARLDAIEERISTADSLTRLHLAQERNSLARTLHSTNGKEELAAVEENFVEVAAEYSARNGVEYEAWREAGVSPAVLRRAGIKPQRAARV